ncbi:NAD(P)/FAD-dependent oxidoreductase [Massilia niastensis]|uniref:NAD(P)/FAD-dependent oxidoreductase n=1 Tax=Massilia niastensis TaxID=544911 RepID=UPI000477726B|nr:NAD(P)/FAD-dependent oxidoreductase [Massilia niastensis]
MESIVIVGGGVAGLDLATRLGRQPGAGKKGRVVLVDSAATHFWKPLLHAVAAGTIDPGNHYIDYAKQAFDNGFDFVRGEVVGIDREARSLTIRSRFQDVMETHTVIAYDRLVLALGSVTNFFAIPGAEQHCLSLDSVAQAEAFRRRFLNHCAAAGQRGQSRNAADKAASDAPLLDIVIVGAGPTGIELAADLRHTVDTLVRYRLSALDSPAQVRIRIIERSKQLLPSLDPSLALIASEKLKALGIEIHTETAVSRVTDKEVFTTDGQVFPAAITVWAAGVKGPDFSSHLGVALNRNNQILVDEQLRTLDDPHIHAMGDCCSLLHQDKKTMIPPSAQAARQQSVFLSRLLTRRAPAATPGFQYRDYGSLVSLGRYGAVGTLRRAIGNRHLHLRGAIASLMYLLIYERHVVAVIGPVRTFGHIMARRFRSKLLMPVKWH